MTVHKPLSAGTIATIMILSPKDAPIFGATLGRLGRSSWSTSGSIPKVVGADKMYRISTLGLDFTAFQAFLDPSNGRCEYHKPYERNELGELPDPREDYNTNILDPLGYSTFLQYVKKARSSRGFRKLTSADLSDSSAAAQWMSVSKSLRFTTPWPAPIPEHPRLPSSPTSVESLAPVSIPQKCGPLWKVLKTNLVTV